MVAEFYITISYLEQDDDVCPDTVYFAIPMKEFSRPGELQLGVDLCNAIDDAMETLDRNSYDGVLDWLDAVFSAAAERMHAYIWRYLHISKHIEV